MTFVYFTRKSGNLNILGSYDTQMSEPGPQWPSCFLSPCPEFIDFRKTKKVNNFSQQLWQFSYFVKVFLECYSVLVEPYIVFISVPVQMYRKSYCTSSEQNFWLGKNYQKGLKK